MDKEPVEPENSAQVKASEAPNVRPTVPGSIPDGASSDAPSKFSAASLTSWAKNLKITQPQSPAQDDQPTDNAAKLTFARFTSGLGLRLSPKAPQQDDSSGSTSPASQPGLFGTLTKGIVDTSKNAAKAVQVKARHAVSQNKRRYQEGGFDLDMTYITENIIAMGFPAGDMSSGFFGYVEGLYRNHMDEVIKFFETNHKDKYKVYNLCSERLYDASLFEGKVASFPFDDHNCPPIQLIISFCQSAYSWLKQDIENVVVVHCKAGMARTGLMISSLLLFLKFFPTAEESIDYYNQKRCMDSKGLVLPSQIRYVKYFERTMTYFNGENQPGRRCMLRGFRLHRCPYWIRPSISVSDHNGVLFSSKKHTRTKDLSPEEFWFTSPKKGIMVFALPGEPGLTELCGDFKVHFHDGQGDFYCTMMENRKILNTADLDGFDKRKLPSPGFQVEVVLADYDGTVPMAIPRPPIQEPDGTSNTSLAPIITNPPSPKPDQDSESQDKDDVFSDSEADESSSSKSKKTQPSPDGASTTTTSTSDNKTKSEQMTSSAHQTENVSSKNIPEDPKVGSSVAQEVPSSEMSEFKAMAADASVFSFGDDEDYESD